MNKFKGKTKQELEGIKLGLESYMEGASNIWNMMNDFYNELNELAKEHIDQVNRELRKVSE